MKVTVTGGGGFLGSRLARALLALAHQVVPEVGAFAGEDVGHVVLRRPAGRTSAPHRRGLSGAWAKD